MSTPADIRSRSFAWPSPQAGSDRGSLAPSRLLVPLFAVTLFTSAVLMFVVEPMVAKMLLPMLGGAPAVWNTCLVFFQAMLLAGYAYAHGATHVLGVRRHIVVHSAIVLLPLLVLPVGLHQTPPDSSQSPVAWLLVVLCGSIGLPFFVLSTSAAVLQKWFATTDDAAAADPYFLYAASNLGSFIALLAYPAIIEPTLRLPQQSRLWSVGYVVFVTLTIACAVAAFRRGHASAVETASVTHSEAAASIAWPRRLRWIALAFVPSSLLLAVTNHISTDVASVPLLWIVPLALYLLAFVIAFSPSTGRTRGLAGRLMPILVIGLTLVLISNITTPLSVIIPLHLLTFFAIAVAFHEDLAEDRPPTARLTEFYFWIAFGGMLGGLFNALVAPVVFTGILEYPLVLVAACLLRRDATSTQGARRLAIGDLLLPLAIGVLLIGAVLLNNRFHVPRYIVLEAAIPALVIYSQRHHRVRFALSIAALLVAGTFTQGLFGRVVYAERSFFGVNRVRVDERLGYRFMFHGTTLHGMQSLDSARRLEPEAYYHRLGPIGQVFAGVPQGAAASNVGVIGLGIGSLASYRSPAQEWTFYEIAPVVERIAENPEYFTYLSACGQHCRVIIGDGRVSLAKAGSGTYGVIILDAFSSDAVPMHLMTKEALALYFSKLAPGGVVAFHISNLHLTFSSVLARMAEDAGVAALWQEEPGDAGSWESGKFPSSWFVMARTRADFGTLTEDPRWKVPAARKGTPLWTDDFSNILSVIR